MSPQEGAIPFSMILAANGRRRRKRNTIDYTFSNIATETEAKEIFVQAAEFYLDPS